MNKNAISMTLAIFSLALCNSFSSVKRSILDTPAGIMIHSHIDTKEDLFEELKCIMKPIILTWNAIWHNRLYSYLETKTNSYISARITQTVIYAATFYIIYKACFIAKKNKIKKK